MTERQGLTRMTDAARIHWRALDDGAGQALGDQARQALDDPARRPPVVLLHGGPGLPDYLGPVAASIADLAPVYRYDQRGTGRSPWQGRHTLARHVADLAELLDAWSAPSAVLIGHSYGADLASRFCLAHPGRVAAMLLMCGPFVGDWRTDYRAARAHRMTPAQRERLSVLQQEPHRTEAQEVELLTLSWFTDHADPERGWPWAAHSARLRRPVNWAMNRELGEAGRADPLDLHLDTLRARLPTRTELLGGTEDPRPLSALASLAHRLDVPLTRIADAGHEPWLERPEAVRGVLRGFVRGRG
ncbi:alpha/beta fold hydrolase [Streptomyces sp. NPDC053474]|uniref:alpha/beta fold hydrolase n=1 Tax=Streptomyces sp. NPDC053474 TaxID=3365704 RepID=UPI0037D55BF8